MPGTKVKPTSDASNGKAAGGTYPAKTKVLYTVKARRFFCFFSYMWELLLLHQQDRPSSFFFLEYSLHLTVESARE